MEYTVLIGDADTEFTFATFDLAIEFINEEDGDIDDSRVFDPTGKIVYLNGVFL